MRKVHSLFLDKATKMRNPQAIDLSQEEAEWLKQRIRNRDLEEGDWKIFEGLVQFVIWLQFTLKETKIRLGRLRRLFGISQKRKKSRKSDPSPNKDASENKEEENPSPTFSPRFKNRWFMPSSMWRGFIWNRFRANYPYHRCSNSHSHSIFSRKIAFRYVVRSSLRLSPRRFLKKKNMTRLLKPS